MFEWHHPLYGPPTCHLVNPIHPITPKSHDVPVVKAIIEDNVWSAIAVCGVSVRCDIYPRLVVQHSVPLPRVIARQHRSILRHQTESRH